MSTSRTYTLLALLAACGGGDEVVSDASPVDAAVADASPVDASTADANVDAASPDAAPPDGPSGPLALVVGPVTQMEPTSGSTTFLDEIGDVAWSGNDFVLVSGGLYRDQRVWRVSADGTVISSDVLGVSTLFGRSEVACQLDGTCLVVWMGGLELPQYLHYGVLPASGSLLLADTAYEIEAYTYPLAGAYDGGYVVGAQGNGLQLFRANPAGVPLEEPITLPTAHIPWMYGVAMSCNAGGCTVAVSQRPPAQPATLSIYRIDAAGGYTGPTVVAGFEQVNGLACISDRCLLTEQLDASDVIRGQLLEPDGAPIDPPFVIATIADGNRQHNVAADASSFVLTTATGTSSSMEGQLHAYRVAFDGTIGLPFEVMPSQSFVAVSTAYGNPDAIGCSPTRCLAVASLRPDARVARIDGSTVLDDPPRLLVGGNEQENAMVTSNGEELLFAWRDQHLTGGEPERELQLARWSPSAGWLASGLHLQDGGDNAYLRALEWNGLRYIALTDAVKVVSSTGTVLWTPATGDFKRLACRDRCLVGSNTGGHVIESDGTKLAGSDFAGAYANATTFDLASGPAFITVSEEPNVAIQARDLDGDPIETVEIAGENPERVAIAHTNDRIVVFWRHGGVTYARTADAELSLGPTVELPIPTVDLEPVFPFDQLLATTLGDSVVLVWHHLQEHRFYAMRLDGNLAILDVPFPITPRTAVTTGHFFAELHATGHLGALVWTSYDELETLGVTRLSFVPIQLLPTAP